MNPEQLGNISLNGNKIHAYVERPKAKPSYLTNSGVYICSKRFLKKHDFGSYLDRDFFPGLPDMVNAIGYVYSGEWEHIQNDSAFERINGELL